jgi:hypothetical protein
MPGGVNMLVSRDATMTVRYRACDNTWVCDCGGAWSGPLLAARVAAFPDGFDFAEAA